MPFFILRFCLKSCNKINIMTFTLLTCHQKIGQEITINNFIAIDSNNKRLTSPAWNLGQMISKNFQWLKWITITTFIRSLIWNSLKNTQNLFNSLWKMFAFTEINQLESQLDIYRKLNKYYHRLVGQITCIFIQLKLKWLTATF